MIKFIKAVATGIRDMKNGSSIFLTGTRYYMVVAIPNTNLELMAGMTAWDKASRASSLPEAADMNWRHIVDKGER